MASEKITAIVESVKTMTVLELKELVDTRVRRFRCCCCRSGCCWRCCSC